MKRRTFLGLVGGAAAWHRTQVTDPNAGADTADAPATAPLLAQTHPSEGLGGALGRQIVEPASSDDFDRMTISTVRARPIEPMPPAELLEPQIAEPMEFRDASLVQRVTAALTSLPDIPLLRRDNEERAQN